MRLHAIALAIALAVAGRATAEPAADGAQIAAAAERQVGVTVRYDPAYVRLDYPDGDVPLDRGVCSDVVIRAFRTIGVDLQRAVHEDMRAHFDRYPRAWGLRTTDRNIDHRRVLNLMTFFERRGKSLDLDAAYAPGDVVAWRLPNGLPHIGIVATATNADGVPLVAHNIGAGAQVEDVLHLYRKTGHYRW